MLWPVVKALLGHYRRYPLQIILVWLGLTLGVSLLVGVTAINQHARQSYEHGEKLFSNPNSKIFRRDYLDRTHAFYERHGGKTDTLARFVPIVRTFAPFVAGVGKMPYLRFLSFSVGGTLLWVGGLIALGYSFGNVEFIKKNLSVILLLIVALSFMPAVIHFLQERFRKAKVEA